MDVSEIAAGVGFTQPVSISPAFLDAIKETQVETEADYDQRLYDAMWLAHFELSLIGERPINFTFTFSRRHWKNDDLSEICLRLRVKRQPQGIYLGLQEDF
jgi:hypothetical protein